MKSMFFAKQQQTNEQTDPADGFDPFPEIEKTLPLTPEEEIVQRDLALKIQAIRDNNEAIQIVYDKKAEEIEPVDPFLESEVVCKFMG